eukprot:761935-Rhodomonas_salina.1
MSAPMRNLSLVPVVEPLAPPAPTHPGLGRGRPRNHDTRVTVASESSQATEATTTQQPVATASSTCHARAAGHSNFGIGRGPVERAAGAVVRRDGGVVAVKHARLARRRRRPLACQHTRPAQSKQLITGTGTGSRACQ